MDQPITRERKILRFFQEGLCHGIILNQLTRACASSL